MKRPETEGTMISGRVSQRQNLLTAVGADKAAVILFKAFVFHFTPSLFKLYPYIIG